MDANCGGGMSGEELLGRMFWKQIVQGMFEGKLHGGLSGEMSGELLGEMFGEQIVKGAFGGKLHGGIV